MATIPLPDPNDSRGLRPLDTPEISDASAMEIERRGAAVQQIGQAGRQAFGVFAQERIKAQNALLNKAEAELADEEMAAEQEESQKQAWDAVGAPDRAVGRLGQKFADIYETLPSEDARQRFEQLAYGRRIALQAKMVRHERTQIDAAQAESFKLVTGKQSELVITAPDQAAVIAAIARGEQIIDEHLASIGRGDQAERVRELWRSGALAARVSSLFQNKRNVDAVEAFKTSKDLMTPEDRERDDVGGAVREFSDANQEYTLAQEIRAASKGNLEDARNLVDQRQDLDANQKDRIVRRVEMFNAEADKARADEIRAASDAVWAEFVGSRRMSDVSPAARATLKRLAPKVYAGFEDEEAQQVRGLRGERFTWDDVSGETLRDWYAYKQLPPEQKAGTNLMGRFLGRVPMTAFTSLVEQQESYRDAIVRGNEKDPKLTQIRSMDEELRLQAKQWGVLPWTGDGSEVQQRAYAKFEERANQAINQFERNTLGGKRKATTEEIRPIVDGLLVPGELQAPWYRPSPDRRVYELTPDEVQRFEPVEIPAAERSRIEEMLRRKSESITEEAVLHWYRRKLAETGGMTP